MNDLNENARKGYIDDQWADAIKDLRFGLSRVCRSGCELIAIVNAARKLGLDTDLSEVIRYYETHRGKWLFGLFGVRPRRIGDYFAAVGLLKARRVKKDRLVWELSPEKACIITYWNPGFYRGIHTVMGERLEDGRILVHNMGPRPRVFGSLTELLSANNRKRTFITAYIVERSA